MPDRISVLIAVPVDTSLPVDVQGVGLRRKAIDLMSEIAEVDEGSVRYAGGTDSALVSFGEEAVCMWQLNQVAARFFADGKAKKGVVGPVTHYDEGTRQRSTATVVRDPYA